MIILPYIAAGFFLGIIIGALLIICIDYRKISEIDEMEWLPFDKKNWW